MAQLGAAGKRAADIHGPAGQLHLYGHSPVGRNPSIAPGVSPGGLPDRKMDLDHHLGDVSGHGGMAGEISGCSGIGGRGIHRCFTALLATHPTNRWMPVDLPTGDQTFRLQDATLINHD